MRYLVAVFDYWPNKYYFFETNTTLQNPAVPAPVPADPVLPENDPADVIDDDIQEAMDDQMEEDGSVRYADTEPTQAGENRIRRNPEDLEGMLRNKVLYMKEVRKQ